MQLLVTINGSVNLGNTRTVVINSPAFAGGQGDYGVGVENETVCPGCGRALPTACMYVDQIQPQLHYLRQLGTTHVPVILLDSRPPHGASKAFQGVLAGGTITIMKRGTGGHDAEEAGDQAPAMPVAMILNTQTAWENDLTNLQFLCPSCSARKGPRPFTDVFRGRLPAPLR